MRLGFLGDSQENWNMLAGKPWPNLVCDLLSSQGGNWSAANHALDGFTCTKMINQVEFNQTQAGATALWKELVDGEDYHVLVCGVNDALLRIDSPALTDTEIFAAADYIVNCLEVYAPTVGIPAKPIIFVAMQQVAPGTNTFFDQFCAHVSSKCAYTVTVPIYKLREIGLLMQDKNAFPTPYNIDLHPTRTGHYFIAAWFVKQMSLALPSVFQYQMATFPPWDDPDAAYAEFKANSANWQALKSNWN